MIGIIIQNKRLFIIIVFIVHSIVILWGGYTVGHALGFKSGHKYGLESQTPKAIEEAKKSAASLEKEMTNAKKLSNDDIDSGLNSLGIMRNNEDR